MSRMRVWLLMAVLSVILVLIGRSFLGPQGAVIFFLIALGMNFFTYYYKNAAVAVTEGLLHLLDKTEVEGVLAHELAHIKNRDTLTGAIAATLAGAVTMIADMIRWGMIFGFGRDDEEGGNPLGALILAIVAPLAALLIQLAISRAGEFNADATGARIAGRADGLAQALVKLEQAARRVPMQVNPAASHLFIVNPLSGESFARLFSTHPPIAERVKRLRAMSL